MTDQVDLANCMVCNDKLPTTALLPCGPFAKQRGEREAGMRGGTQARGAERLERARELIWRCCQYLARSVLTIVCAYALHAPTHGGQLPSTIFFPGHKCVCQELFLYFVLHVLHDSLHALAIPALGLLCTFSAPPILVAA